MLPGFGGAGHDIPVTIKYVIAKGPVDCLFNIGCHKTMHFSQLPPGTCLICHELLQGDRLWWPQWQIKQIDHFLPDLFPAKKITVGYVVGLVSGLRTGQRPVCSTSEQFGIGGLVDAAIGTPGCQETLAVASALSKGWHRHR